MKGLVLLAGAVVVVFLALSKASHASSLFEFSDARTRQVNATVYLTNDADLTVCYAARCWLSNGRSLGYRYNVTTKMHDVPTCIAGRGDCPDVYINDEDAYDAEQPLIFN